MDNKKIQNAMYCPGLFSMSVIVLLGSHVGRFYELLAYLGDTIS